jgi:hypothetical protein
MSPLMIYIFVFNYSSSNSRFIKEKTSKHFTSDRKQTQYSYIGFSVTSEMCLIITNQDYFFSKLNNFYLINF